MNRQQVEYRAQTSMFWNFILKAIILGVFVRYVVLPLIPVLLILFVILFYSVGPKYFPGFYEDARKFNQQNVQTSK